MSIKVQSTTHHTPQSNVGINTRQNIELYEIGKSPIISSVVEECLVDYADKNSAKELLQGLKFGFKLNYLGPRTNCFSKNLRSTQRFPEAVREKLTIELELGRIAGPFSSPPFPTFRCSPLALIPKKAEGEFRLVLNLSYPRNQSVNDFIDRDLCTVRYSSMDDAVRMIQKLGKGALPVKPDIKSAFRLLKIWQGDFDQFGFSFENQFYFDRCLPMGSSICCSLFEKVSTALHWFTEKSCENESIIHYLDDFLFGGIAGTSQCLNSLNTFSDVCKKWRVPLAEDKTVFRTEMLTFLGIEIDTIAMELRLSQNKLIEIKDRIISLLNRKKETYRYVKLCLSGSPW